MARNKKIVKYRKPFELNIGFIIFGIIFLYVTFYVFSYFTMKHTSVYEVVQGTIAVNHSYTGLALRTEKTFTTDQAGYINYFMKDSSKAGVGDLIYSIDSTGSISNQIDTASKSSATLDDDNLNQIQSKVSEFQNRFSSDSFYDVYNFKSDLNAQINEALSISALASISDQITAAEAQSSFYKSTASEPGLVQYYTDGYEAVNTENFTSSMFDESKYKKINLKDKDQVQSGDVVYKMVTSDDWNIVVPIDEETKNTISESSTVKIKFVRDKTTARVSYTIVEREGGTYLVLNLHNSVVRFSGDRYIELELLLDEESGLKIPNTSIVKKAFFTVPMGYFTKGNNSDSLSIVVRTTGKDGKTNDSVITPTIYYSTEDSYYIDGSQVQAGDKIIMPNSSEEYTISETGTLEGVYNINKGYAVFKKIEIMYQNPEYTIVQSGTNYGISMYDHIALDGSTIQEDDLVKSK